MFGLFGVGFFIASSLLGINAVDGVCQSNNDCDDNNQCTLDWCDAVLGCQHSTKTCHNACTEESQLPLLDLLVYFEKPEKFSCERRKFVSNSLAKTMAELKQSNKLGLRVALATYDQENGVLPAIHQAFTADLNRIEATAASLWSSVECSDENLETETTDLDVNGIQGIFEMFSEEDGEVDYPNGGKLEFRSNANVHLLMFTGLLDGHNEMPANPNPDEPFYPHKCDGDLGDAVARAGDVLVAFNRKRPGDTEFSATIVVHEDRPQMEICLGSSLSSATYRDLRRFNMALTLSRLFEERSKGSPLGTSLQTRLVAKRVPLHVVNLKAMEVLSKPIISGTVSYPSTLDVPMVLVPALDVQPFPESAFCDHCVVASVCSPESGCPAQSVPVTCSNADDICSIVNGGCVTTGKQMADKVYDLFAMSNSKGGINDAPQFMRKSKSVDRTSVLSHSKVAGEVPVLSFEVEDEDSDSIYEKFTNDKFNREWPCVIKNSPIDEWNATKKWSWSYLRDVLKNVSRTDGGLSHGETIRQTFSKSEPRPVSDRILIMNDQLEKGRDLGYGPYLMKEVKVSQRPDRFVWTDEDVDMNQLPTVSGSNNSFYRTETMDSNEFFDKLQDPSDPNFYHWFGPVFESLVNDTAPGSFLYATDKDREMKSQFMWISSQGAQTHTHFDQDDNMFIQLIGKKKFTFWLSPQTSRMHTYPKIHPLWHKSQIDFEASTDLPEYDDFKNAQAVEVVVGPGDLLYVPPYTWHHVQTLEPSLSLTTLSYRYGLLDHMHSVYGLRTVVQQLGSLQGKVFGLRFYLEVLIGKLYFVSPKAYFQRFLKSRFAGLRHLFPANKTDVDVCKPRQPEKGTPLSNFIYNTITLDTKIIADHFLSLPKQELMDMLFADYVEDAVAEAVGPGKVLAFFHHCFQNQDYYYTEKGEDEHLLWDYTKELQDEKEDEELEGLKKDLRNEATQATGKGWDNAEEESYTEEEPGAELKQEL